MTSTPRTAIVTGGALGIGASVVQRLLDDGLRVVVLDRDAQALGQMTKRMGDREDLVGVVGDVGAVEGWQGAVATAHDRFGPVGVLVNNAAISPKRDGVRVPSHEMPLEEWADVLRVNLTGPLIGFQAVFDDMRDQRWGRVINMSSGAAHMGARVAGVHYGSTKAGILGLTRTLAVEYGRYGITANAICPGRIATPMTDAVAPQVNADFLAQIPVGRLGRPDDIGTMAGFLASDAAEFITGATIDVNGGGYIG